MKRFIAGLVTAATAALLLAAPATAEFGFKDVGIGFRGADGSAVTAAGTHPFAFENTIEMKTKVDPGSGDVLPDGEARDLVIDLPEGLAGDPTAAPRCANVDFVARDSEGRPLCPNSTVVGLVAVKIEFSPIPEGVDAYLHVPIYNLNPPPGAAAKLGFVALNVPITINVGVRDTPPYNVRARIAGIPQATLFYASEATLWSNPASPAHDTVRGKCLDILPSKASEPISLGKCPVEPLQRPFLTAPRSCTGALTANFNAVAWNTGAVATLAATAAGMDGCSKLRFTPDITSQPTTSRVESPSGLDFDVAVRDEGLTNPTGTAHSDIKKAVVTLPEGMTANPSLAEGLATCSEADFAREDADSAPGEGCPQASKIGSVEVETPLLEGALLKGSVFIATQKENPFGSLLALYMTIKHPDLGIGVKLAGKVEPDPRTGQLVTTFGEPGHELPQLPFSDFRFHFREGGRSPLISPSHCGDYTTKAVFTPWANPSSPLTTTATFKITSGVGGGPCPPGGTPPFEPGFEGGTLSNSAASYSPFLMRLTRRDGDQDLTRFDATLPPGVLAKLAGVSRCPDAAIAEIKGRTGRAELASPSCPAGSRIGSVMAGAGVGSQLTYVPGSVYLAGPFAGAPLSVVGVVPAVAGPFDVGVVVTRQALTVDPVTAEAKVDGALSDPIPHILAGIPLKVRDIQVNIDRPNFTLNPTSCDPSATLASIWGGGSDVFSVFDDASVPRSARFQAANCASLGFKPKLSLRLDGDTRRGSHPALRAVLKARPGDANIGKAVVTLPHSAFLAQEHINTICTRVQFASRSCPKGSIYGRARAVTPLLDEPLEGPVYLRSSSNDLPDLVAALHGVVDIEVVGRIDSVHARLRSNFAAIPDAPLTKFVLKMRGGNKGLIVNSRDLCTHRSRAIADFTGQNGKAHKFKPPVKADCGKKSQPGKRHTPPPRG